ncbi:MAG: hypothetical protein V1808_01540 [Candidatus Daviesbacteria bacterium]
MIVGGEREGSGEQVSEQVKSVDAEKESADDARWKQLRQDDTSKADAAVQAQWDNSLLGKACRVVGIRRKVKAR